VGSTEIKISTNARACQDLTQLKANHCSGYQDTVKYEGMNKLMYWLRRAPKLHKHILEKHPTTFKKDVPKCIQT